MRDVYNCALCNGGTGVYYGMYALPGIKGAPIVRHRVHTVLEFKSWSAGTRGKFEMFWKYEGEHQKRPRARASSSSSNNNNNNNDDDA